MYRYFLSVGTALAGMGLAGLLEVIPDGPRVVQDVPAQGRTAVTVNAESVEASTALREAYASLKKLRAEGPRGDGPTKEWLERATVFYRQALEAHGKGEKAKAAGLASAARELARAVELSRQAARTEQPDPELPPPPDVEAIDLVIVEGVEHHGATFTQILPPPIPPVPPAPPAEGAGVPVPPVPPSPPVIGREVRVVAPREARRVEGDRVSRLRQVLGERRAEQLAKVQELEVRARDEATRAAEQARANAEKLEARAREVDGQEREDATRAAEQARKAAEEIEKQLESVTNRVNLRIEGLARVTSDDAVTGAELEEPEVAGGANNEARQTLRETYEKLLPAIEQDGDAAKFYLDAARVLYNAARRDAVVGRNDRAIELAKAAQALTVVPKHLDEVRVEVRGENVEVREVEGKPVIIRRIETRDAPRPPVPPAPPAPGQPVPPVPPVPPAPPAEGGPRADVRRERIVIGRAIAGSGESSSSSSSSSTVTVVGEPAEQEEVVGLGIEMKEEDGKFIVVQTLPGTSAAEDGKLASGDVLVGVLKGDEELTFEGKPLADVVKEIRGPEGSTVKLKVRPKDAEEPKVLELRRQKLGVSDEGPIEVVVSTTVDGETTTTTETAAPEIEVEGFPVQIEVQSDSKDAGDEAVKKVLDSLRKAGVGEDVRQAVEKALKGAGEKSGEGPRRVIIRKRAEAGAKPQEKQKRIEIRVDTSEKAEESAEEKPERGSCGEGPTAGVELPGEVFADAS